MSTPAFIIRDLDKDPHGPKPPSKHQSGTTGASQLISPETTPSTSPKNTFDTRHTTMTRSASDLSTLTNDNHGSASSTTSSGSQTNAAPFPFSNIFKWKRTVSNASSRNSSGLQSPPVEEGSARTSSYFPSEHKTTARSNMDNAGMATRNSKSNFDSVVESQLLEERRLRHLAEDRLAEIEEEVTRLCTISLPTDTGETGDAYFSAIIKSVRLAIDSYEERTIFLEKALEEKSTRLNVERRERTEADVECRTLQAQTRYLETQLREALRPSDLQAKNDQLSKENETLRQELEKLKSRSSSPLPLSKDSPTSEEEPQIEDRATLLQRVKDTEAQRDALRQVSRGLRQRLTIETRKNVDKMRALAAMDVNISIRQARTHSRQSSATSTSGLGDSKKVSRDSSLTRICQNLQVSSRPRPERFVTASESPILQVR